MIARIRGFMPSRIVAKGSAMACPACGHRGTQVIDGRPSGADYRRRRVCLACELRFTTMERIVADYVLDYQI